MWSHYHITSGSSQGPPRADCEKKLTDFACKLKFEPIKLYFVFCFPVPQVTVKDIDEDAEDTDEDSDVLDIPDETLHDDIQSGVVPETFATNEDSLSYNSDPSDYPADFDDDIKHHKYHGADFDDDIKHHKYHDEERGLEEWCDMNDVTWVSWREEWHFCWYSCN